MIDGIILGLVLVVVFSSISIHLKLDELKELLQQSNQKVKGDA